MVARKFLRAWSEHYALLSLIRSVLDKFEFGQWIAVCSEELESSYQRLVSNYQKRVVWIAESRYLKAILRVMI
jgi:hypothetical protein